MPVYKAEAIILHRRALGEADRVITLYTREHGKLSAVARAVRKTTSRLAGRLEPFTHARLLLARGRTLDVIAQVEVLEGMAPLRADLRRFGQAALVAELLEAAVPEREPHADLFRLLLRTLDLVARADPDVAAVWFALHLMSLVGFHPAVDRCAVCGRGLGASPSWSHPLGGLACSRCAVRDPLAVRLRPETAAAFRTLLAARAEDLSEVALAPRDRDTLADLVRRYAEHRLEVRLRSPGVISRFR